MRRFPSQPVVGVGAVILDEGRVVLVKRGHPPLQGAWSVPGGVVELAETLEQAVAREVREETGLNVEVGPLVQVVERIERSADGRVEYHYVIVDYLCRALGVHLKCGSDADDARWIALADLEAYAVTDKTTAVIHAASALQRRGMAAS